jgi:hypothetical protein
MVWNKKECNYLLKQFMRKEHRVKSVNAQEIVIVQKMEPVPVLVKKEHVCVDQIVPVELECMKLVNVIVLRMEHVHVVKDVHVIQKIVTVQQMEPVLVVKDVHVELECMKWQDTKQVAML